MLLHRTAEGEYDEHPEHASPCAMPEIDTRDPKLQRRRKLIAQLEQQRSLALDPGFLVAASGGDGTVRFYDADTLAPAGKVELGGDADNVRIHPVSSQVLVGYGGGGLGRVDVPTGTVVAKIYLGGHPESFQIEAQGSQQSRPSAGARTSSSRPPELTTQRRPARLTALSPRLTDMPVINLLRLYPHLSLTAGSGLEPEAASLRICDAQSLHLSSAAR